MVYDLLFPCAMRTWRYLLRDTDSHVLTELLEHHCRIHATTIPQFSQEGRCIQGLHRLNRTRTGQLLDGVHGLRDLRDHHGLRRIHELTLEPNSCLIGRDVPVRHRVKDVRHALAGEVKRACRLVDHGLDGVEHRSRQDAQDFGWKKLRDDDERRHGRHERGRIILDARHQRARSRACAAWHVAMAVHTHRSSRRQERDEGWLDC